MAIRKELIFLLAFGLLSASLFFWFNLFEIEQSNPAHRSQVSKSVHSVALRSTQTNRAKSVTRNMSSKRMLTNRRNMKIIISIFFVLLLVSVMYFLSKEEIKIVEKPLVEKPLDEELLDEGPEWPIGPFGIFFITLSILLVILFIIRCLVGHSFSTSSIPKRFTKEIQTTESLHEQDKIDTEVIKSIKESLAKSHRIELMHDLENLEPKEDFKNLNMEDFINLYHHFSTILKLIVGKDQALKLEKHEVVDLGTAVSPIEPDDNYNPSGYKLNMDSWIEVAGIGKSDDHFQYRVYNSGYFQTWQGLFGEDSAGVSANGTFFALADGVGSCGYSKIASSVIVHALLDYFDKHPEADLFSTNQSIINHYIEFIKNFNPFQTTTLVLAQIKKRENEGTQLKILNIGDSYCSVVDPISKTMIFQTKIMECNDENNLPIYNCPHQISDDKFDIHFYEVFVKPGHWIYLYSDGVGDNLYPASISKLSSAVNLVSKSRQIFKEGCTFPIPFEAYNPDYPPVLNDDGLYNGKEDDLSAILIRT